MLDIHIDHLQFPRNMGTLKNADLVLETKSTQCEDMIKMYFKFDENGIILDIKYEVFGCWAAIVSASMFSEYAIGKNRKDIQKMTEDDLLKLYVYVQEIKERCFLLIKEITEQL